MIICSYFLTVPNVKVKVHHNYKTYEKLFSLFEYIIFLQEKTACTGLRIICSFSDPLNILVGFPAAGVGLLSYKLVSCWPCVHVNLFNHLD